MNQTLSLIGNQIYFANYTAPIEGTYEVTICANDTHVPSETNCTTSLSAVASGSTNLTISPAPATLSFGNVTIFSGQQLNDTVFLNNTGYSRGLQPQLFASTTLDGATIDPQFSQLDTVLSSVSSPNFSATNLTITIPAGTPAGNYSADLLANWTNLDNTTDNTTGSILLRVLPLAQVTLAPPGLSYSIPPSFSSTQTVQIISSGNMPVYNVTLSCVSGVACLAFNVAFNTTTIPVLYPGNSSAVNITVGIPSGEASAQYNGTVKVSWVNGTNTTLPLIVIVQSNMAWQQFPSSLAVNASSGQNGTMGQIQVTNIGNVVAVILVNDTGSAAPYLSLSPTTLTIQPGYSQNVTVNYSAPVDLSSILNFTANLTFSNATAPIPQQNATAALTVLPFSLSVLKPTSASKYQGVTVGENLTAIVNVTYASEPVNDSNLTFGIILTGPASAAAVINSAEFLNATGTWQLNFSAPSLPAGQTYGIQVAALSSDLNLMAVGSQNNAISYVDNSPPVLALTYSPSLFQGAVQDILLNVTDGGLIYSQNVTLNLTSPANPNQSISLPLTFQNYTGESYLYTAEWLNTIAVGTYLLTANACNSGNFCASISGTFTVTAPLSFDGLSYDQEAQVPSSNPLPLSFMLYSSQGALAYQNNTDLLGRYNQTIAADTFSAIIFNVTTPYGNHQLAVSKSPIVSSMYDPANFGVIPAARIGGGALTGLSITPNTNLTYSYANITFSYASPNLPAFAVQDLAVYSCANYTQYYGCANNTWVQVASTLDPVTQTITTSTSNLGQAYALATYICGDGVCETNQGETFAVCNADCVTPTGTGSGSGAVSGSTSSAGVGSGGGGSGVVNTTANLSSVGTSTNSTLLPPYSISSNSIIANLNPGQSTTQAIDVTNNQQVPVTATITDTGSASAFLTINPTTLAVNGSSTSPFVVTIAADPASLAGSYTGTITINLGANVFQIPVTVTVSAQPQAVLEIRLNALNRNLQTSDPIKAEVTLVNIGEVTEVPNAVVTISVQTLADQKEVYSTSAPMAVKDVASQIFTLQVPNGLPPGQYILQATVNYGNGQTATANDEVEVASTSLVGYVIGVVSSSWITYLLAFLIAVGLVARKYYKDYLSRKVKAARYIFPLDFKKLPPAGERSIPVGVIAETNVTAYMELDKLTTHCIAAGGTGSGKSVSAQVMTEELLKRRIPVIVFDPTAQWAGFIRPNKDPQMLPLYEKFGIKPEDAHGYKTNIIVVRDPNSTINVMEYLNPEEITVFVLNKLSNEQLDGLVRRSVESIFASRPPECKQLKVLIVFDEVHRLLPKYGGKGAYTTLERGFREFRKWGLGLFLISQVLLDFKGAIRANIATEIQLRTKYEGDIGRVKTKYGTEYASRVTKLTTGSALVQNPEYNDGKPWFVSFRPLYHSTFALTDAELDEYDAVQQQVLSLQKRIAAIKASGKDTYELELELRIGADKLKQGSIRMAQSYVESLNNRLKTMGA